MAPIGLTVSFGNASGPVPQFPDAGFRAKGSLFVMHQSLYTHSATRERPKSMADDFFTVVTTGEVKFRSNQCDRLVLVQQAHIDLKSRKTTVWTILRP